MKLGKLPARKDAIKFKLSTFVDKAALPKRPAKFGHQGLVTEPWGVLGNDNAGDCVWAGAAHETMLWCKTAGVTAHFDDHSVLSDYSIVTGYNPADPNTDQGTDMAVAASYRRKTGVVDAQGKRHQVAAYLEIAVGDIEQIKLATYLFTAVGIGFNFPTSAMTQFNAGKPWTVVKGSRIDGGHYVPVCGYDSRYLYVVTWGKVQKMSLGFAEKYMDEAVAYVSLEMLTGGKSLEGFDAAALQADLAALKAA